MSSKTKRIKATQLLILATALWGLSFPTMKALAMTQEGLLPGRSSWFFASLGIVYRFGAAALIMLMFSARTLRSMTRLELLQGIKAWDFWRPGNSSRWTVSHARFDFAFSPNVIVLFSRSGPLAVIGNGRRTSFFWAARSSSLASPCSRSWIGSICASVGRGETIVASVIFTGQISGSNVRFAANNVNHFSCHVLCDGLGLSARCRAEYAESGDWLRATAMLRRSAFSASWCSVARWALI
jgi:hypothetical protein